jgi:hypothetical protein
MKRSGSIWKDYSYGWITAGLFAFSLAGHWLFGWFAFVGEQAAHGQPVQFSEYLITMTRDTLENWQSEFLQLLWQVGGLAFFLYLGSPQSKEGEDRIEEKVEALLRRVRPEDADRLIEEIDRRHGREEPVSG